MLSSNPVRLAGRLAALVGMLPFAAALSAEGLTGYFNVPAQPATTGIPEFARQGEIQILVPEQDVHGVQTAEVVGLYTIQSGLAKLLAGTNLSVDSSDNDTITLAVKRNSAGNAAGTRGAMILAQATAAAPSPSAASRTSPAPETSTADSGGLEEIVVTATRRETSLSNTPISISALSATDIERDRVVTMDDVARMVPSLVYMPQSASETYLSIRGTSTIDDSTGTDQGVNMFVDDVVRTGIADLQPDLYDMERVEVLNGPQGTLFGRNSLGGTLSLYTKNPVFTEEVHRGG
jgi:iron complex outermembrane receptor protein